LSKRSGIGKDGKLEIEFMPTSLHCYTIARNLLRSTQMCGLAILDCETGRR